MLPTHSPIPMNSSIISNLSNMPNMPLNPIDLMNKVDWLYFKQKLYCWKPKKNWFRHKIDVYSNPGDG